jgi:hypothetical protein
MNQGETWILKARKGSIYGLICELETKTYGSNVKGLRKVR